MPQVDISKSDKAELLSGVYNKVFKLKGDDQNRLTVEAARRVVEQQSYIVKIAFDSQTLNLDLSGDSLDLDVNPQLSAARDMNVLNERLAAKKGHAVLSSQNPDGASSISIAARDVEKVISSIESSKTKYAATSKYAEYSEKPADITQSVLFGAVEAKFGAQLAGQLAQDARRIKQERDNKPSTQITEASSQGWFASIRQAIGF